MKIDLHEIVRSMKNVVEFCESQISNMTPEQQRSFGEFKHAVRCMELAKDYTEFYK